jgi:hypothetical protein
VSAQQQPAQSERKNAYYCAKCGGYVVTRDVDEGVTPMFLACRVKGELTDPRNDCKGTSRSMMYPPEPWPDDHPALANGAPATWEWYSPSEDERRGLNAETREHVNKGGLLLRRIGRRPPPPPPRKARRRR